MMIGLSSTFVFHRLLHICDWLRFLMHNTVPKWQQKLKHLQRCWLSPLSINIRFWELETWNFKEMFHFGGTQTDINAFYHISMFVCRRRRRLFRFFVGPVHSIFMLSFLNSLLLLFINNVMIFKKIKRCTCRRQVHFVLYGSFFARTNRKLVRSDVKKKTLSEHVFFAVRLRSDENFFRKKLK